MFLQKSSQNEMKFALLFRVCWGMGQEGFGLFRVRKAFLEGRFRNRNSLFFCDIVVDFLFYLLES